MKIAISDIFKKIAETKGDIAKADLLKQYAYPQVLQMIRIGMDPSVKWAFEKGWKPAYKANNLVDQEGTLYYEMKFMDKFLVGGRADKIKPEKRKILFMQLLDTVSPGDAEMLILALEKKIKGLHKKIVDRAFPGLIRETENA